MKLKLLSLILALTALFVISACGNAETKEGNETTDQENQGSKEVMVDGSSTVFPIMEAVAEEYSAANPDVRATIGVSGTGGGFEKFINGETDISNASRPIKEEESAKLEENNIEFTEFELALDGLSVVVNIDNDWVDELTVEELSKVWTESGSDATWADIRDEWPNEKIEFFSPGTDSGTYDYFDEVILDGEQIRKDASLSEDDNVLVQGVAGSKNGLGYFGYAYYIENEDKLKVVPIVNSKGDAVTPTLETIQSGEYEPLSRPMFLYMKHESLKDESVYDFAEYTLENAGEMSEAVGYVALPEAKYEEGLEKLKKAAGK